MESLCKDIKRDHSASSRKEEVSHPFKHPVDFEYKFYIVQIVFDNLLSIFLWFLFYCCSVTMVSIFLPDSPCPTHTLLPTLNPPPASCLCAWVLHTCPLMTILLRPRYPAPPPLSVYSLFSYLRFYFLLAGLFC